MLGVLAQLQTSLLQRIPRLPSNRHFSVVYVSLVLFAVVCRHFLFELDDPNKCNTLLREGRWYSDNTWLIPGCVTERFGSKNTRECLSHRKLVFAGDLQLQPLFWSVAQKINHDTFPQPDHSDDLRWSGADVELEFIYDPFLNGSVLSTYIDTYRDDAPDAPSAIVIGAARWHAEHARVEEYNAAVEKIALNAYASSEPKISNGMSLTAENGPGNLLLFAPIEQPYNKFPEASSAFGEINTGLEALSSNRMIDVLWSFREMTRTKEDAFQHGGWNPRWEVIHQRADILLGLRCNAMSVQTRSYPHTRTCCGLWDGPNSIQITFLVLGLAALPLLVVLDVLFPWLGDLRTTVRAFWAFTSTISLQFLADWTHIFEQVQRLSLHLPNLYGMLFLSLAVGVVTVRRSSNTREKKASSPFLPRHQSDEMKGWMQLLIIIYHYNMAWTFDRYWEVVRLAVSAYLFLTGFGHAVYFLQKQDYSRRRLVTVLIRTNLLPCTLAYIMRTRWLLYYYMPLSTFWFLVVYATLAIGSEWNQHVIALIGKIAISAGLVHAFVVTPDLAEAVVKIFAIIFKVDFNGHEFFHHRVKIDQYIVYVGMLVAICYIWCNATLSTGAELGWFKRGFRRSFAALQALTVTVALAAFIIFWLFVQSRVHSQSEWTVLQPYITCIPIITFLVMRNGHSSLRNWHSVAFAWLGRYSGEIYVMQDHLWLAGDQEAVLRTGLFHGDETVARDRWRDLVLLTPFYLIACAIIGDSTSTITSWLVADMKPRETEQRDDVRVVDEAHLSLLEDGNGREDEMEEKRITGVRYWRAWRTMSILAWPRQVGTRFLLLLGVMWALNLMYK